MITIICAGVAAICGPGSLAAWAERDYEAAKGFLWIGVPCLVVALVA